MATLSDALRADDKLDTSGRSLAAILRDVAKGFLQSVGPFYGYGVFQDSTLPKVELESREIIKELNTILRDIHAFEAAHHHVVVTEDMAHKLKFIFRHLPGAVDQEGWSADWITAVSRACQDLACISGKGPGAPINLLYHSVLGDLAKLDSIPPAIAYPILLMVAQWDDLARVVKEPSTSSRSTSYWSSTLEIGRQVVQRSSMALNENMPYESRGAPHYCLSEMSVKRARQIISEHPIVGKLLSA